MPHDNRPRTEIEAAPQSANVVLPLCVYETKRGRMFNGLAEDILQNREMKRHVGKVQLIFTSPPFPLNRKKKYGNHQGDQFIEWLSDFAPLFRRFLKKDGSIVMEMGNSWEPGEPIMSTLALRALLAFIEAGDLQLCQQFIAYNPARLPSPAQWVNVERIRVKDAFTHIWWMAPKSRPKANNRGVLNGYSKAMKRLLLTGKYNAGLRPSEHHIGEKSFNKDNGGAIPSNVLTVANTGSSDPYLHFCRDLEIKGHPARMPAKIPEFFINFLTDKRNLVLDPFAGSNTTGEAAEKLKRRWLSIEARPDYVQSSIGRFPELWTHIPKP